MFGLDFMSGLDDLKYVHNILCILMTVIPYINTVLDDGFSKIDHSPN